MSFIHGIAPATPAAIPPPPAAGRPPRPRHPSRTGFTANITITNTGTTGISGWTLAFSFPTSGQKVGQGWSANYTQTGTSVTASNVSYNGVLAPGASTSFGFNGTHTGSNPKPTTFTLNGMACTMA